MLLYIYIGINTCLAILSKELVERVNECNETGKVPPHVYVIATQPYLYTMTIMGNVYSYLAGLCSTIIYRRAYDKSNDEHLFLRLNVFSALILPITFIPLSILATIHRVYITFR